MTRTDRRRFLVLFAAIAALIALSGALAIPATAQAQEIVLVSNTDETAGSSVRSIGAQSFRTGSAAVLTSVDIRLGINSVAGGVVLVRILEDDSGNPGAELVTLLNPSSIVDDAVNNFTAPAGGTMLTASTTYYVVLAKDVGGNITTGRGYRTTGSHAQTGATDWEIGDSRRHSTGNTLWNTSSSVMMIAIKGTAASTDATLSGLTVTGGGSDLVTFVSGTTDYTASVANDVETVTFTATKNDDGASVAYLDSDDNPIADADTADGQQVTLVEGDNVIKVKVTAADGSTLTYTVTVNRPAAANSAPVFSDTMLTRSVAENAAANQNVGAVIPEAADADGDTLEYSMEGTDAASFTFDASARQIKTKTGVTYDHEAKSSYAVTIRVSDGGTDSDTVTVAISVTDVDEPPATPAKPTVSSTSGSTTSLDVSWTAPANAGKPAIASYDLRYSVGDSGTWTDGPQDETGTSSAITGLTAATEYQVQVRATNAEGDSGWSDAGTGSTTTPACTLNTGDLWCGVVTVGTVIDQNGVTTGHGFEGTTGDLSDKMFTVGTNPDPYTISAILTGSGNAAGYLSLALTEVLSNADENDLVLHVDNDSFAFSAASRNSAAYNWASSGLDWSSESSVTLRLRGAAAANVAPSFTSSATFGVAENGTTVGTVEASDDDMDDEITGYALTGGADQALFSINDSGVLTFQAAPNYEDPQDADTDNAYEVTVQATSGTGGRVQTAIQTITVTVMNANEQPAMPAKPTVTAVSGATDSLAVTWTEPDLNGGPAITGYGVQYRVGASGTWMDWTHMGTATTTTITGLTADTDYQVQVRALNGETPSDWSDPSDAVRTNAEMTPVVTIAKDKNVVLEEEGAAGFTLSRTGSTTAALTVTVAVTQEADRDILPDGAAAERTVTFAVGSATTALMVTLDDDDLKETRGKLTVEVQAGTGYTVGDPASATVSVGDGDTGRPMPANLMASPGAGAGEVVLSWDAHAPYLTFTRHQYRYKTDGDYLDAWTDIPNSGQNASGEGDGSNLTGYTVTGLVGGQVHSFQVRTYSSVSSSDPSDEAMATPRSAVVSFGAGSYSVDEGGAVDVTVQLDAAPGREVVVPVSAAGAGGATPPGETGADWSGVPENVTFGATDTAMTFTLAATQDLVDDDGESVALSFGTLPDGVTAGSPSEATVTITDDDAVQVIQTATLVSNTGESGESTPPSSSSTERAQAFSTGPNPGGYNLVSVGIVSSDAESSAATVSLCEVDSGNFPTSTCTALTAPASFPAGTLVFTAPAGTILTASTTYAMVVNTSDAGGLGLARVESDDEDAGGAAGWTIANGYMLNPTSGWANTDTGFSFRITITGSAVGGVSTDATLSGLTVTGGGSDLALTPTFASDKYAYATPSVANAVDEVTVTPTKNSDGATIEYLDSSDMMLDDADMAADGQQVTLTEGDNVIKVKVTAADGSTLTYTVTVNRPAATQTTFVSNLGQRDVITNSNTTPTSTRAQQFETGSNPGGYTLTEIVVNIRNAQTGTPAFALHTSTAGDAPGTKVVDLSGDSSTAGEQSFTPASATTLSASTKYFIVFSMTNGQANLQRTGSNNIDSGASTGWDIAETSLLGTSSSDNSVEIAVKGTAVGGTPPASTDATTVTIVADQAAFTAALDDVIFTLTRTEDPAAALDVAVALTQDQTLLASADLGQTVTFAAGEASATLIIQNHKFASHTVTEDAATLTATVQDGTGYEPGSPNTVSTRIVVADPAVTAWIEATAYTFAEDATGADATITVILRTATGVPSPNRSIYLSFSTAAISGQAEVDDDYVHQSQLHEVSPSDFMLDGDDFTARKEVTLVIVDDAIDETDETLTVILEPGPSTSELVALRQPDGTACTVRCDATVTIVDNDDPQVIQTVTLVSNTGQGSVGSNGNRNDRGLAFTTGPNPGGYNLDSVGIVSADSAGDAASVSVCTVGSDTFPTSTCTALTAQGRFTIGERVFTAPSSTILAASTTYALVVGSPDGELLSLGLTSSDNEDTGGADRWTIANDYMLQDSLGQWANTGSDQSFRITITGSAVAGVSTDATLSGLTVTGGGSDLVTFVSGTYEYDASVANTVDEVTVTPTLNDTTATIEYLDASDMTLTDADASTAGQQVELAEGDNVIKVKVTVADKSTSLTYTVTVNRPAATTPTCTLNTGDLWCGVVTVGPYSTGGTLVGYGFFDAATDTGALPDTEFTVGLNSYTIDGVWTLRPPFAGSLNFSLTSALAAADLAKLVLHVGSTSLAFSNAGGPDSSQSYQWLATGLDWSSEDYVTLRLRALPDAPTNFTATVGDTQVALAWDPPASDSGVTGHEFRYKTDGDYPLTWMAIADSALGGENEGGFTVTGLTNEVAHTFELRAVNASGEGDAAMAGPVTPTPGICDRTAKIQDAILAELSGVDDCAAVTVANLDAITEFGTFGLGTFNQGITSLQKGDFAGLTSLTILNLSQNSLTSLPEGIFAGLAELAELDLSGNQLESLPEGAFDGLVKLRYLSLVGNSLTELRAGEFTGLTALENLLLSLNDLSSLPEAVFSDLTALDDLHLNTNDLSSLPEGLFSGLTALVNLELTDNDLNALPEGLFSGLTALEELTLNGNDLDSLPEGLFSGLTALTKLYLDGNPTNPMELTVTVERVGTDQVRAKVLAGAPFAVAIPVTLVNGTLTGSATALSVAAGSVDSEPVTMTRTAGTTAAATVDVDLSTQPTLPANHKGYIFKKAATNLPATILPDATNAAPAFTSSTTFNPAENQTAVGTVMAKDDDTGDDITGYALNGGADEALFSINDSGVLTFQAAPNYEDPQDANTDNAYVVVVRATSGTGARVKTADQTITVTVMNADEQTDTPAKPTVTAVEGSATSLTATWVKPGLNGGPDITSYDVEYREGMSGTWTFGMRTTGEVTATIDGLTASTEHQVRVRALNGETPSDWSDPSDAVSTNTEAATAPTIDSVWVTSTPVLESDTYGAGEDIEFTVTFDEAVDVAGDPIFRIALGNVGSAGDVDAAYASGGGTTALVFSYTVLSTDVDDNGIFLYDDMDLDNPDGPVRLDSDDSIVAVAGAAAADLTWTGGRGTQSGHKVDGSRSIIQVEVSSTPVLESDTYGAGETIRFTVTFNLAVDVAGDPIFRFALGNSGDARDVDAAYASGSGTTALVFSYTVVSTDVDGNGIFLYDGADLNNPDGPVRLDSSDSIQFTGTSTDVPLAWPSGRGTQSSHKVDGSQTPGNSAPAFSGTTATRSVAENTAANQNVGAVIPEAMDDDGDSLTYSMEGTDAASFTFDASARQIQTKTGVTYNHEEKSTYSVTVKADDDNGGTATVVVTITVTDVAEQPATPAKPTLAVVSSTSLTATWVKPGLNGGPDITGYNVNYRVSTATAWETFTHSGAGVTRTITGLTASTSYQVRVRALNGETASAWSDPSEAVSTNTAADTPTVEPGELEDRLQAINCALDALDGESDERCDDIEGMPGSNRDLVALQLEVIGQLPPGKYDYYELAGWQTLYKMEDGRVIITKDGDAGTEAPAPLTARLEGVPEAHDGETAFRFRVAFSEDIGIDDQSLRDHSFTVSGGEVTGAQRDRHDLWEITVAPDSDGDVTITLPGDRKCGTAGAVCTRGDDPSPLTNSPSATVAGPAGDGRDPNTAATGTPTISGTVQVGETLTADTSGIADEDGLENVSFSYQWLAGDSDISGATGSAYTLADADEGKTVKVRVSFTDDGGNDETLTSAATEAVAAKPNSPATGAPTISGTAQVGETLTADTSGISDADRLTSVTHSYQWLADDTAIQGATNTTYTLVEADEGKAIKVRVSFTDDGGNDETLTSAATEAVAGNEESAVAGNEQPVAREDVAAWSATMTVEWVYQGYGYYSTDTKKAGSLSPASFEVDGTTYTVKMVETQGWWTHIGVDREIPFDFVLELDGVRFASGDASFASYSYGNIYRWEGTGLSLRDGDAVEVRLHRALEDETAVNSAATGAPIISGTVQVGETLTADTSGIEDADGLDDAAFTYRWLADAIDISGATGSTYTLADADENKAITVQVSFTDDAGNDETLTSAATDAVAAAPPENSAATGAPTISGTAQVGETLTADTSGVADEDGLESVTFSYQWLSGDSDISGATGSAYTPVEADEGKTVKVRVSFTDDGGNDETLTSAATEAVAGNEEPVAREDVAAWSATMTVEWVYQGYGYYSTDTKKAGSLTPASFEVDGTTYTVKIVETQGWWTHIGVDRELPFDFVLELDGTRFASSDASFASYSYGNIYRWEGTGLSLRDGDVVEVRLLRAFEDETAVNSAATGAPIISGTVQVGETLTVDTSGIEDADGLDDAAFTYRWLADNAAIAGATGSTYTLADADEGKAITVQVSFTDDAGNDETLTSEATDAVSAATQPNNPATGAPTISGTAQVGETLTAGTSGIVDADGLTNATFNYQWLADDTDISGATGSTYTLVEADEGKAITVQVSFTDDAGNDETLTSGATGAVATAPASNTPATGAPAISGTAQVGETLAADTSGIADADGLSGATFSYQWVANDGTSDTDITGATDSTYTLAAADEGKTIKVRVSFTDDAGYGETLTSPATGIVAAALLPLTASLENMPDTHDGQNVFTFELRFSEEFSLSYKMLRDHAFTVAGGTVEKAERITKGSNLRWLITVRPDGDGQVTITLPATTDCDAEGAICTGDGRMLSNELVLTVDGPGQ